MGHWHDDEPCKLSNKECDAEMDAFIRMRKEKKMETETITYGYDKDNQRNPLDRIILITETNGTKYEMPYPSADVSDSEALHHLLCFVDPGEEYTVVFKKKTEEMSSTFWADRGDEFGKGN